MIIHQPMRGALGLHLIEKLQSGEYNVFRFIAAYAKISGVNRMLPYMRQFKESGGHILGIVGIDQKNTSYEALMSLRDICDTLFIYHSEDFMKTFHVKAYNFEDGSHSWTAIGSHNFTAGGLFSNYEASMSASLTSSNREFTDLFDSYSNTQSPCCKAVTPALIETLFENRYIQKESDLARQLVLERTRQRNTARREIVFGTDSPAIAMPAITAPETIPDTGVGEYLIRHVPRAGNRSKQVHFTLDILSDYFQKRPGDDLQLQQIDDIYNPHYIENRSIVLSQANRNVRIEVAAAEILNDSYPTNANKRPILLFRRVNSNFYEYMLLMDGNLGYDILNGRLLSLNWHHRSLPYEIVDAGTLLSIWENCPLV